MSLCTFLYNFIQFTFFIIKPSKDVKCAKIQIKNAKIRIINPSSLSHTNQNRKFLETKTNGSEITAQHTNVFKFIQLKGKLV